MNYPAASGRGINAVVARASDFRPTRLCAVIRAARVDPEFSGDGGGADAAMAPSAIGV